MQITRMWPHVRAGFVLFHILAILALSLPGETVVSKRRWKSENVQSDFAGWAGALRSLGIDTTPKGVADRAHSTAEAYVKIRQTFIAPFAAYKEATGSRQGWAMFASPQRHPVEMHIDIRRGDSWSPIFRPRSTEYRWRARELEQHRLRKLVGRFAREFQSSVFTNFATYLTRLALADFPDADGARVRLYRYDALPPERVRKGELPQGKYAERLEVSR